MYLIFWTAGREFFFFFSLFCCSLKKYICSKNDILKYGFQIGVLRKIFLCVFDQRHQLLVSSSVRPAVGECVVWNRHKKTRNQV